MLLLVDENVRGLARWLRFLGFDTALAAGEPDSALLAWAEREGRVLLTRDRALAAASPRALFLDSPRTRAQLASVLARFGWPAEERWFTRCVLCNEPLESLPPREGQPLWRCGRCGRLYWRGSHWERTRAFLRGIEAQKKPAGDGGLGQAEREG